MQVSGASTRATRRPGWLSGTTLSARGGGVAGIAWTTGVLAGLADAGTDVSDAEFLLGSSAGSVVGAQLAGGADLTSLYRAQVDPALQRHELMPREGALAAVFEFVGKLDADVSDPVERRRRMGEMALATDTVAEADRLAFIEAGCLCTPGRNAR